MSKSVLFNLLRWVVTVSLLIFVFYKAGLFQAEQRAEFLKLILSANIGLLLASIGVGVVGNFSSAVKWYMLVRGRHMEISLWRIWGYLMVGKFFNLVLPTSMGGDVVRLHLLGRHTGRMADAVASVFVERFTGMVTLFLLVGITVILNLKIFNTPIIMINAAMLIVAIGFIYWVVADARPLTFLKCQAQRWTAMFNPLFAKIEKFQAAVAAYGNDKKMLVFAFINSLIFFLIAVVNVWVSSIAFDSSVLFNKILNAVAIILLIMNLPVSIGGLGLMEFSYSLTFELIGYSAALALSVALLMRLKTIIDAIIGAVIHLLLNRGRLLPKVEDELL